MTSIRKTKKGIKADMADIERYIAKYERKPATWENILFLDALRSTNNRRKEMLEELKRKRK